MSLNRYAARRDSNEDRLFALARQLGAHIQVAGPMDGWVGHRGHWTPVEVKDPKYGRYTPYQVAFLARCKQNGLPVFVWRDNNDVLRDLGAKVTA